MEFSPSQARRTPHCVNAFRGWWRPVGSHIPLWKIDTAWSSQIEMRSRAIKRPSCEIFWPSLSSVTLFLISMEGASMLAKLCPVAPLICINVYIPRIGRRDYLWKERLLVEVELKSISTGALAWVMSFFALGQLVGLRQSFFLMLTPQQDFSSLSPCTLNETADSSASFDEDYRFNS